MSFLTQVHVYVLVTGYKLLAYFSKDVACTLIDKFTATSAMFTVENSEFPGKLPRSSDIWIYERHVVQDCMHITSCMCT